MNTFDLSPDILVSVSAIERLYGQLEALHLPQKLQLNLERDNLIHSSYVSNSIEGNPLSYPEVSNLLLGGRVPANRSEQEVRNYFDILKGLEVRARQSLTLEGMLQLHRDLIGGLDDDIAGRIRNKRVVVGNHAMVDGGIEIIVKHEPPYHRQEDITGALQALIDWENANDNMLPIVKIGIFHHYYVYIHPFVDGNGRTVRLLTAWLFIRAGYLINKYFVLDDYYDLDRQGYSDALHTADNGDSSKWLEYFTLGTKYSLQSALEKSKNALLTLNVSERPTTREQDVLRLFAGNGDVTSTDVVKALAISRQQAQNLLSGLVEKGLITKFGITKSSYYRSA